jgi:DNA-binding response OmpR family regulator
MKILIVEDDDRVADALGAYLGRVGFETDRAANGRSALELLDAGTGVVVLDLGLPDVDGIDLCQRIRARSGVPVIIATARNEVADRIKGLRAGADDFVVKPFDVRELVARIEAVTRRAWEATPELMPDLVIQAADTVVDFARRRVLVAGAEVDLTRKEYDVVAVLARSPGAVVSRERIIREVWQSDWRSFGRSLEVHIGAIRRKLGSNAPIETVRGFGYRLVID